MKNVLITGAPGKGKSNLLYVDGHATACNNVWALGRPDFEVLKQ